MVGAKWSSNSCKLRISPLTTAMIFSPNTAPTGPPQTNILQIIRAHSLTACIGHFHALGSLRQWCMLHQVDLDLPETTELVDADVQ